MVISIGCDEMAEDDQLEKLIWMHGRLSGQIDREFDLLGQRTLWLITGNAFLFTVTALSVQQLSGEFYLAYAVILVSVVLLGIRLSKLALGAMEAAQDVVTEWKQKRALVESKIQKTIGDDALFALFPLTPATDRKSSYLGMLPHSVLPSLIIKAWYAIGVSIVIAVAVWLCLDWIEVIQASTVGG